MILSAVCLDKWTHKKDKCMIYLRTFILVTIDIPVRMHDPVYIDILSPASEDSNGIRIPARQTVVAARDYQTHAYRTWVQHLRSNKEVIWTHQTDRGETYRFTLTWFKVDNKDERPRWCRMIREDGSESILTDDLEGLKAFIAYRNRVMDFGGLNNPYTISNALV
jgi:hypothetical protein